MNHGDTSVGGVNRGLSTAALFDTALWVFTALVGSIALIFIADWIFRASTLPVQALRFEGEFKHVTQAELEQAVLPSVRGNFLRVDLDEIRTKVEQLPWVQSASVRRAWPRDVYVQFTEQKLLARWNADAWVNQALVAVRVTGNDVPVDAVRLEGPEGTQAFVYERYQNLNASLAASGLKFARVTLTPRRTWRLELDNGLVLVLDRDEPERKLERFAHAWSQLARDAKAIQVVDLRYTNGFAVQFKTGRAFTGDT